MDIIVDFIGKDYFNRNVSVMRRDGKMVLLAFMSGAVVDKANIAHFLAKRLQLRGSTLRSRTVEYQAELLQSFKEHALQNIVNGKMKVEVHKVYPWTEVIEGQKEMAANKNSGKVGVLSKEMLAVHMLTTSSRLSLRSRSSSKNVCPTRSRCSRI